jgi:hypothetical protein
VYQNQLSALNSIPLIDPFYQRVLPSNISEFVVPVPPFAPVFYGLLIDKQREAVEYSLTHRFGFIGGGAGTGKTICAIHQAISFTRVGCRTLVIALANDSYGNLTRKIRELTRPNEMRRVYTQSARHLIPPDLQEFALPDRDLTDDQMVSLNEAPVIVTTISSVRQKLFGS